MSTPLKKGSTYTFRLTATKDGVAWSLTGATVTLQFKDPTGTVTAKTATGDSTGASYVSASTDLDAGRGTWTRTWKVVDGTVVQESNPIYFSVSDPP